jgi:hypothetical protein
LPRLSVAATVGYPLGCTSEALKTAFDCADAGLNGSAVAEAIPMLSLMKSRRFMASSQDFFDLFVLRSESDRR